MRAGAANKPLAVEDRVLVLAPTGSDAKLSESILTEAGIHCQAMPDTHALCSAIQEGAGAAVITEESLFDEGPDLLAATFRAQPEWSDIPVLLLASRGANSPLATWILEVLGNVTVLERPVRIATLVSAVRSALKARRRQYELRDRLEALRISQEQLNAALEDIRQNERRKDEFLATLAHELRNPMAPIMNALRIMEVDPQRMADTGLRELLDRQARHMVRLIDDLLDISRITRGKLELRLDAVELGDVLKQALETVEPHIQAAHHRLAFLPPAEEVWLRADRVRLGQVFANLLNNASKYTPQGGSISISTRLLEGYVEVTVSDSGVGLEKEEIGKIFDLFSQIERPEVDAMGGLGIGLTLVTRLVEMHGGSVEAHSEGRGRGSSFVVRLPTRASREEAEPAAAAAAHGD